VTYSVLLHPKAAKELQRLDSQTRARIVERARELSDKPEAGKPLTQSDFWSLCVEDYRTIYHIDRERRQVVVLFVGHRSQVYDDLAKML
jgi:mRNA-degrading endonuclease RelE of RelBE toxin-antitoxin system